MPHDPGVHVSAYVIVSYDIVDREVYTSYVDRAVPILAKHGGELLVADADARPLEGKPRSVHVVLRFASEEAALTWYHDPAYVAVKRIRVAACDNTSMVLAKEHVPPAP
jgi:uncharacterized protein (DUF1330 family)